MNRRFLGWLALLFPVYFLVATVVTWPLAAQLGSALPGSSSDSFVHYWNGWWVKQALLAGQSPYYSDLIFYPQGVSLILHNLAWLSITPWLFFQLFLPGLAAYNLVLLINLALCGLAAALLVHTLTDNRLAAVVAGVIYLAWPFRITQLDHPNLISTYWLPLTLLFIVLWLREGRTRYALAGGVSLALVGYTRWQMLIPAAAAIVPFVLAAHVAGSFPAWSLRRHSVDRRRWAGLLLIGALAVVLLAPPATMLAGEWQSTITSRSDLLHEGEEAVMQTDLLAYVTPGNNHPLWGDLFERYYDRYYAERSEARRFRAYVGLTAALLAGVGLWRRRRESLPWLLVALTLVALAMGSVLRVGGQLYPEVPTLYRLLEPLYVVRLIRVPDRFNVTLALPAAVVAGYGVAVLLRRLDSRRARALAAAGLSFLILFEYLAIPVPLLDTRLSPFYQHLAQQPSGRALLNMPLDAQDAKAYMFAQTTHGRPIIQGKVARIPLHAYGFIDSNSWLATMRQVNEMAPWLDDVSQQLRALAADGVDHIVLHKTFVDPDRVLHWQRYLIMAPIYEDEQIAVYTTAPRADQEFALLQEMAPDVGPLRVLLANGCVHAGDAVAADVAWGTRGAVEESYELELALVSEDGTTVRREPQAQTGLLGPLPSDSLVWRYLSLETPAGLAAGDYDLMLSLAQRQPQAGGVGEAWRLGQVQVRDAPCRHDDLPDGATTADARFGNVVRLLGYETQREGDRLQVTLYWRMMQHMERNYTVFVHVFDPATGVPVAQDDAMPHRGGYPTRFWAAGETVVDHIPISLDGAEGGDAAGSYGLAVGLYDAETMERLTLVNGSGELVEDGRLVLRGEVVRLGASE